VLTDYTKLYQAAAYQIYQGMSDSRKFYHILTRDLPWTYRSDSINAFPIIPPKDVFERWIEYSESDIRVRNDDTRGVRPESIGSIGGRTDANHEIGEGSGEFSKETTSINVEIAGSEPRPPKGDTNKYSGAEDRFENGIRKFCRNFDLQSLDYGTTTTAVFGNGVTRTYDRRGSTIRRTRTSNDGKTFELEQIGEFKQQNSKNHHKFHTRPWKVAMYHWGTKNPHWHLIYVSKSGQWGHNSNFGRDIRQTAYRCQSIKCLTCLRKYFYSGDGRQVVQDILQGADISACECALHQMRMDGYDQRERGLLVSQCEEGRDIVFAEEGESSGIGNAGVVKRTDIGNSDIDREGSQLRLRSEIVEYDGGRRAVGRAGLGRTNQAAINPKNLIILLVEKRAFNEGSAQRVLCSEVQGIEFLFQARSQEKVKIAVLTARVLVFQETKTQRLERAKQFDLSLNPEANKPELVIEMIEDMIKFLKHNNIDFIEFFKNTYLHYKKQLQKKNNLFFIGPPSTGKTMIMETLVACHYNFTRLTGLSSGSTFNFSSLLHTNACLMDECKLTENQFEQWKLLAGGSPMSTDVKFKEKHDIDNCVLYTSSNYPIDMYVSAPDSSKAIETRTITYRFNHIIENKFNFNTFGWEACWQKYVTSAL